MNNHSTLQNALPIVAAAYGRKFGVHIQIGGNTAGTDGQTIHLPTVAETAKTLAYGYLAHESGHLRLTDFGVARHLTPLGRAIENIVEDIRIENAMIRMYPGTRSTLDCVVESLITDGNMLPVSIQLDPPELFCNGLLHLLRHRYRQQTALSDHAKTADHVLRQVFGARLVHRMHGLLTEIPTLKSTADAVGLASKLLALMEEESQHPPSQPPPEDADDHASDDETDQDEDRDSQGSGDQGPPDSNDQGRDERTEDTESNTPHPNKTGTDDDTQDQEEEQNDVNDPTSMSATKCQSQGTQPQDIAITTALQATLDAKEDDLPKEVFEIVAETLGAQSMPSPTVLPTSEHDVGNHHAGRIALQRVKIHSAKITARLQGLVQAQTLTRHRTAQRGRRLSSHHLHRAGVGDPRIFRIKEQKVAPNTALHLLVDLSGSMARGQDRIALESAMALALALESITGVTRAVTAFPGLGGREEHVTSILIHGERVAFRAGAFIQSARGSTPMTGALWYAAADLLSRPEPRRVLLTLTDGDPDDHQSAKQLIDRAQRAGIACIGLGIGIKVDHLFPVAVQIDDVADLKTALFGLAETVLLK